MESTFRVTPSERRAPLEQYWKGSDPRTRLRVLIALLLAVSSSMSSFTIVAGPYAPVPH